MYQSNKSLLVIQEATKNDKSTIPKKLLEYIVQLQETDDAEGEKNTLLDSVETNTKTKQTQRWYTAREQSAWILTQLQNIFLTKQRWRIIKVSFILQTLLWKGSRACIEEFHTRHSKKELCFFDFEAILVWLKEPQTNDSGDALPSVFDEHHKAQVHDVGGGTAEENGGESADANGDDLYEATHVVMPKLYDPSKLTAQDAAFMNSWKQNANDSVYRLSVQTLDSSLLQELIANHVAYFEALLHYRYDYPQVDLMNIVVHDANIYGEGVEKERMSLMQLESLMAATLELIKSTAFRKEDRPLCPVDSMTILFRYYNAHVLYNIAAQVMTGLVSILGQHLLKVLQYVDETGADGGADVLEQNLPHVQPTSPESQRITRVTKEHYERFPPRQKLAFLAREWYTMLYQLNRTSTFYIAQSAEVQKLMQLPIAEPKWLHVLPPESFEMMKTYGSFHLPSHVCPWCLSEVDTPQCHPTGEHHKPPCAVHLVKAWRQQVKNAYALFEDAPPSVLHTLNKELEEMQMRWRTPPSNGTELSSHEVNVAPSTCTTTGTFILRRKGDHLAPDSPGAPKEVDIEVLYLEQLMGETSESIEALLQEDDVVVVCPDDFSATDRLKLADRFSVQKQKQLGEGSYGKVYRAWDEREGTFLAAKEVPLDNKKGSVTGAMRDALHEYTVLTQLHHPHIVAVKAFMVTGSVGTIFMEWMPCGSLQEVLHNSRRRCLREPLVARYMRDALRGLEYLHSRDIMHRDVKPANMLLGADGAVKLTDFGNCFVMPDGGRTIENHTVTGTAPYMAPEYARSMQSRAGDIWSLGCTAVELLSGRVPWSDPVTGTLPEMLPLIFRIGSLDDKKNAERPHTLLWDVMVEKAGKVGLSAELRSFLDAIFVADRHARPTATQLLQHPFITK